MCTHGHVCVSECHVCVGAGGGQMKAWNPLKLELLVVVSCPVWVLGPELGSLEEQEEFLTAEPSL